METGQVNSWFRYQGNQLGNKIQWLKYDMGGAIAPGCQSDNIHRCCHEPARSFYAPTFPDFRVTSGVAAGFARGVYEGRQGRNEPDTPVDGYGFR